MSTPYPPQPRRLMRDPNKKLVGGVCSGLAKYLNMDVNLVRILRWSSRCSPGSRSCCT